MWSRKRLDIQWTDMLSAAAGCLTRWSRSAGQSRVERKWSAAGDALVCLSVRTAWDLWLSALNLPAGSEVLMSALTIPDMARIVEHHGLVPVPLDLDVDTLAPSPETLRSAVTPRTRAVLMAHLFGTRNDLADLITAAHKHDLLFVEDCAQAYTGPDYTGHAQADVSLFSFGTIKTATALGGAIVRVRDARILADMRQREEQYPVQSRSRFAKRVAKYSGLKLVSQRPLYGWLVRGCRWLGKDHDHLLNQAVKGFGSAAPVERFQVRPSAPLLGLMHRRLAKFRYERIQRQTALARRLWDQITPDVRCPGGAAAQHNFWVFPVLSDRPASVVAALRAAGFDATQGESLKVVNPPPDRPELEAVAAERLLREIVYVPLYPALTEAAIDHMAAVLCECAAELLAVPPMPEARSESRGVAAPRL